MRQITRFEAESLGYVPDTPAPEVTTRPWKNKATGETVQVPRGIDPGWQTHPGLTRAGNVRRHLAQRLDNLPDTARTVAARDMVRSAPFRAVQENIFKHQRRMVTDPNRRLTAPVAMLDGDRVDLIRAKTRTVSLSVGDAAKQLERHPSVTREQYEMVQDFIQSGAMYEDAASEFEFVFQRMVDGVPWAAVIHVTKDRQELFLKSFHRIRAKQFGETDRFVLMDAARDVEN